VTNLQLLRQHQVVTAEILAQPAKKRRKGL
jgi:hypothetical protein